MNQEEDEPKVELDDMDDGSLPETEVAYVGDSSLQRDGFLDVANAFRNKRNVPVIRETLISLIFSTIPADRIALLLNDADGVEFEKRSGRHRRYPEGTIQVSRSIVERVYKTNSPILSNDLSKSGLDGIRSLRAADVRGLLCVPMSTFDQKYGVIYVDTCDPFVEFDRGQLDWLMAVGTMAALALGTSSYIEDMVREFTGPQSLIGDSAPMVALRKRITKVAPSLATVRIFGESGTGKELVARAIHENSKRAAGPFIAFNCATATGDLVENELFGHDKEAYTGATKQHIGKFERADGGTIFLDEIGELNLIVQAKLLRFLQERSFERVGGSLPITVDVRVVVATHRNLEAMVEAGTFREDLFHRLNVITIETPSLRDRPEDILDLARHFLHKYAQKYAKENARPVPELSSEAETRLLKHTWPGNVRELENAMERAVVLGETHIVSPADLGLSSARKPKHSETKEKNYFAFMKAKQVEFVTDALANPDRKEAIETAGLHRTYFDRLIKRLGLTDSSE